MAAPGPPPSSPGSAAPLSDPLLRPLAIGGLSLDRRLVMAPMAGLTTPALRRSVRSWGAGLVFTEMISAYGVHYDNRRTLDYFAHGEDEHPLGFQLFGADADVLADAAGRAVAAGADLVDLNMACPVRKVVKTGAGAALLAEPDRAAAIVTAVVAAVESAAPGREVPVTVKIRAGLRDGDELGRLHGAPARRGRRSRRVHPPADGGAAVPRARRPPLTFALAAELPVPVIASGDVDGRAAALDLLDGGAAAVMLARHAIGAPWLFGQVLGAAEPAPEEKLAEVRRFAAEALAELGARAVGHLRQFWPKFRRHGAIDKTAVAGADAGTGAGADPRPARRLSRPRGPRLRNRGACPILARHFGTRLRSGPRCRVEEEASVIDREIILTPEGFQRLKEEVEYLSSVKRDEVAERIRAARDFGDISENSEYDDAKNEQAMLEARIYSLEERLRSAIVIDSDSVTTDAVGVGTKVTLQDMQRGDVVQYAIVGSSEADPSAHKLSNESPVGRAIIGHKPGDKVTVAVPQGSKKFKVLAIDKA